MNEFNKLKVNEIFQSVQGEGSLAGRVQTFVRFNGCNLRCSYCDTKYAQDDKTSYTALTPDEIMNQIKSYGNPKSVCLTGGEPLDRLGIGEFIALLLNRGYYVSIETNGTVPLIPFKECKELKYVMDIKCPGSGVNVITTPKYYEILYENLRHLTPNDEIKFVVSNEQDLEFVQIFILQLPLEVPIFISAVFQKMKPKQLVNWLKELSLPQHRDVRIQLQLHKYIWNPEERGV